MVRNVNAIYEKGVFRPLEGLEGLAEHAQVRLSIEEVPAEGARLSDFAGLWNQQEADEIASVIEEAFERVDPNDW